jgi:hypothetical protein
MAYTSSSIIREAKLLETKFRFRVCRIVVTSRGSGSTSFCDDTRLRRAGLVLPLTGEGGGEERSDELRRDIGFLTVTGDDALLRAVSADENADSIDRLFFVRICRLWVST